MKKAEGAKNAQNGDAIINLESSGYELPSTGSSGSRHLTVLGSILIAGTALLALVRRRKHG